MSIHNQSDIQIKGIREGLLVTITDGKWEDIQNSLLQQIQEKEKFFKGAKLALEVGIREMHAAELGVLRDRLADRDIGLWAVLSSSPVTEQNAQVLGLATKISSPKAERKIKTPDSTIPGENAVFINRTVRSGFKVLSHEHIIVMGDVNPGGEIIAGGSIIIWGRCKGLVHAGADGDESAVICALELTPMQLRIANYFATSPKGKGKPQPELAKIINGQVVAETWKLKAR